MRRRPITTNTAAVRENYSIPVQDGAVAFFSTSLSQTVFNRSQAVAQNFQQYRIKYVKLTFKPPADTFAPTVGNQIPQLYFQMNKYASIPTTATIQSLLDMGCRPIRFDDKNIVKAYKPIVLLGADVNGIGNVAQVAKVTPWMSTNAYAQSPQPGWIPSAIEHLGCCFFVSQFNASTHLSYTIDIEVVFQFRRPLEIYPNGTAPTVSESNNVILNGDQVTNVRDTVPSV